MDKKEKIQKKLKLSTQKKKSRQSNSQLLGNKTASIRLERLSDAFVAEMTTSGSALQSEQIMELGDEALTINSLPAEMLISIFSHLSQNELGGIARVCRRWNMLTKDPVLWKEIDVNFHNSHIYQSTVVRCFLKSFVSFLPCAVRIRLCFGDKDDWKYQLNFKNLAIEFQTRCPALRTLILEGAEFSKSLHSIIDSCTLFLQNVKTLVLDSCGFPILSTKEEKNQVGTSKIEVLDITWTWLSPFDLQAFLKLPHLKQFYCCGMNLGVYLDKEISLFDSFFNQLYVLDWGNGVLGFMTFQAICNHGLNLKELYICDSGLYDDDFNFKGSVLPRLMTICLREIKEVTCKSVISLIQSCQSLQNVYVRQDLAVLCAAHPFFVANKCKLEIVKTIPDCDKHRKVAY